MNVNRFVCKDLMFDKVLPDRNNKWQGDRNQAIILQHDGASGHKMVKDMLPREAMDKYGLDVQPPTTSGLLGPCGPDAIKEILTTLIQNDDCPNGPNDPISNVCPTYYDPTMTYKIIKVNVLKT